MFSFFCSAIDLHLLGVVVVVGLSRSPLQSMPYLSSSGAWRLEGWFRRRLFKREGRGKEQESERKEWTTGSGLSVLVCPTGPLFVPTATVWAGRVSGQSYVEAKVVQGNALPNAKIW